LKFLVDIGVSKAVEEWMREAGYDVLGVRDIDPKASDSEILSIAVSEQRIIITLFLLFLLIKLFFLKEKFGYNG
jgi:predicted nuclease of predicted toxin-antitoxin system